METSSERKKAAIKFFAHLAQSHNAPFIVYIIICMHIGQLFKNKDREWRDCIIFGGQG